MFIVKFLNQVLLILSCILLQPVYVIIERDEETKKIQASIKAGMSANASHLQSYLSTWDRYELCTVIFSAVKTYRLATHAEKLGQWLEVWRCIMVNKHPVHKMLCLVQDLLHNIFWGIALLI